MITQYPLRTIDLSALRENVRLIKASLPAKTLLMVSVKADAYGHGIVPSARSAIAAGADWLAVARTCEGAVLRRAGIEAPILVLGASGDHEIAQGVENDLTLAVCNPDRLLRLQKEAERLNRTARIHIKLDTGMGRIGVRNEAEIKTLLAVLAECPNVSLTGAFTHFADADGEDDVYTRRQLSRFRELLNCLPEGIIRHCANSAAIHRYPEAAMDMVRAGISMYGCPPVRTDMPLRPVMDWRTVVTFIKQVEPGDKISYGCTFTADRPMRLATVACGYGDGYHRSASGRAQVLIRGRRAPVVGRICMDQMMVDITGLDEVCEGDEVMLMGTQGNETITPDELGSWAGTIGYEMLLAASERVHRLWVDADE